MDIVGLLADGPIAVHILVLASTIAETDSLVPLLPF